MPDFERRIRDACQLRPEAVTACVEQHDLEDFYAATVSAERADAIRDHLASCDACLSLARDFALFIKTRPLPQRSPLRRMMEAPSLRIAAALVLVVTMAIIWVTTNQQNETLVRGTLQEAAVELIAPKGTVADPPHVAEWRDVKDVDHYEVELRDVRLNVVWKEQNLKVVHAEIPVAVTNSMLRGSEYAWRVTAIMKDGRRTMSPFATFKIADR